MNTECLPSTGRHDARCWGHTREKLDVVSAVKEKEVQLEMKERERE